MSSRRPVVEHGGIELTPCQLATKGVVVRSEIGEQGARVERAHLEVWREARRRVERRAIASVRVRGEACRAKQLPGLMCRALSRLWPRRFGPRVAREGLSVERAPRDRRGIQRHWKLELMGQP